MDIEKVKIGTNVDIKRSDGRIHSATITAVCVESRSVTVEWFEKGETKGKEIDCDQLIGLNPGLLAPDEPQVPKEENKLEPKVTNGEESDRKKRRQTSNIAVPSTVTAHSRTFLNGRTTAPPKESQRLKILAENYEEEFDESPFNNNDKRNQTNVQNKKASNTVQEIERLKKNREERRAKQEEIRLHKNELHGVDTASPNWEFSGMIKEFQDKLEYQRLRLNDCIEDHKICVCVRKRPLSNRDVDKKELDVITVPNRDHMIVHQPQTKVDLTKYLENQTFRFDYAFDESSTNEIIYKFSAQPLVRTIFEQGFATCFAYGQTGSGKTHTMGGEFKGKSQQVSKGIYAMTARDVFRLRDKNFKKENLQVSCSFFEIYSGKVFDLLNNKAKLRVLEDGKQQVQIVGLQEVVVNNENDVLELIQRGSEVRTAGQTSANSRSSRSHAVFQIILRKKGLKKLHGKFSLIDLAGNERGADTISSDRITRMEGAEINKSLLALKECIRALGRKNAHLPFRASKLTLVLRDSFIGDNARTCMIAMISPGMSSCEHTLNTLRYANRVKELGVEDLENAGGCKEEATNYNDTLSEDGSDLALLHSHNEKELGEDLYNMQMIMDQNQEIEERLVDEHSKCYHEMRQDLESHYKLLKKTEAVDYDSESYAKNLLELASSQIMVLSSVKDRAAEFLTQLRHEEIAAQKAVNRNVH